EADILLEVVDITHENAIEQSQTVGEVLAELGAAQKPRVTALNKIDLLADPADVDASLFVNAVPVSAVTGAGLKDLLTCVGQVIPEGMIPVWVLLPFAGGDLVETFHRRGRVQNERQEEAGTYIEGALPPTLLALFQPYQMSSRRHTRTLHASSGDTSAASD